jgi:hypothetical protein
LWRTDVFVDCVSDVAIGDIYAAGDDDCVAVDCAPN